MEDEDFLAAIEADNAVTPEPKVEPETPAQPEAAPAPAPAEPEPVNPLTPPVVEAKPDPGFVPITVVLDEREKRQKLEAELAQFRASQQQQQPPEVPNVFEDPDGFAAFQAQQAQQAQQATLNAKLDISEEMARDKFGDEVVDKARDWALQAFQQRPGYFDEVIKQRNPYRYVVEQFQREQIASQVSPTDFEQFMAWKQAQAGLQQQPAPAAPTATPPQPTPPKSLASAPSAGSVTVQPVQSDEEIFAETFARK